MESRTEVFPCRFFPPIMVSPFGVGSITAAWIRFTFSISSLLIFIDFSCYNVGVLLLPPSGVTGTVGGFLCHFATFLFGRFRSVAVRSNVL